MTSKNKFHCFRTSAMGLLEFILNKEDLVDRGVSDTRACTPDKGEDCMDQSNTSLMVLV
jgi:hypothetical protein